MPKPNFDYRAYRRRRCSTRPVKTGYREGFRENDDSLYSEVRDLQESAGSALDQDSRDFLVAASAASDEPTSHIEATSEVRDSKQPGIRIAPEPGVAVEPELEIAIPTRVIVRQGKGWSVSVAADSPRGKRALNNRQRQQRLSRKQRQVYEFGRLVHPKCGNIPVDRAATMLGIARKVARYWHVVLRDQLGDAEFEKSDISPAMKAKMAREAAFWERAKEVWKNLPAWPKERPKAPVGRRVIARSHVQQSQQKVPRAATYPADGMDNF